MIGDHLVGCWGLRARDPELRGVEGIRLHTAGSLSIQGVLRVAAACAKHSETQASHRPTPCSACNPSLPFGHSGCPVPPIGGPPSHLCTPCLPTFVGRLSDGCRAPSVFFSRIPGLHCYRTDPKPSLSRRRGHPGVGAFASITKGISHLETREVLGLALAESAASEDRRIGSHILVEHTDSASQVIRRITCKRVIKSHAERSARCLLKAV